MAALGYLGSTGAPLSGPLPDPKSQLPSLAKLRVGFQLMHEKKWAEAEATFRELVELNPQMVDAWEFLGRTRIKLGRPDGALAAYQEALERSGGAPHVAQNVASILFDLGRFDDAAAHARLAESAAPSFTHGLLARIAMKRHDLAGAEREARLALEDATDRILPRLTLAEVLQAQGKYEMSLDELRQAREAYALRRAEDPDLMQGTRLLEGMALADLGDAAAAETAFREEMRLFPDDPRAYANLALLQALTGRGAEAGETLRQMTEVIPTPDAYAEAVRALRALRNESGATTVLAFARRRFPESTLLASLAAR
jgi:tetratricopeptide (TPR) repeat protein